MKAIKLGYAYLKKYSLLKVGFTVIISIMVLTFGIASHQIEKNQKIFEGLLVDKSESEQLFVSKFEEIIKDSKLLLDKLSGAPVINNQFDIDNYELSTDFMLLKANLVDHGRDRNIAKLRENINQILRVNDAINSIIPELGNNLARIESMTNSRFWETQDTAELAFEEFEKTSLNIQFFRFSAVLVSIILTFFILKSQKISDKKLAYQASTDMLTRLPNRLSQVENIQDQMVQKPESTFAVVFIDIDYFKIINDNYGHDIGDTILNRFAGEIKSHLKEGDVLSRFGGDEFVLLLRSIDSKEEAKVFIKKLSSALDTSFQIGTTEVFITASIGVSVYSEECRGECNDPKTLLKHADIAMYSAKRISRNSYRFFSKEAKDKIESEHTICHSLHTILRNENVDRELYLKYQPLLNIDDQNITECEALIRWTNLDGVDIAPDEFIPLAEKSNLIEKINLFVIDEACSQQYEWKKNKQRPTRININLSGNKIVFDKLIDRLKFNLEKYDLEPSLFGIELTERTINHVSKEAIQHLEDLRKKQMKISIDDFGTGYSSLSELKNLPVTTLKIDKTFIQGLPHDKKDHALVKTIIDLGHSLDLDIVAEGVETIEQHKFLKKHQCNYGQGYYYQHPLRSDGLAKLQMCV